MAAHIHVHLHALHGRHIQHPLSCLRLKLSSSQESDHSRCNCLHRRGPQQRGSPVDCRCRANHQLHSCGLREETTSYAPDREPGIRLPTQGESIVRGSGDDENRGVQLMERSKPPADIDYLAVRHSKGGTLQCPFRLDVTSRVKEHFLVEGAPGKGLFLLPIGAPHA